MTFVRPQALKTRNNPRNTDQQVTPPGIQLCTRRKTTMPIVWKDSYKINNAEIDAQHQYLFTCANAILEAQDQAALSAGAMQLYKYTREHFTHEENLMRRVGYPAIAAHMEQHNLLISKLNEVARHIAHGNLDRAALASFLTEWLTNHIAVSDQKLAKFVQLKR